MLIMTMERRRRNERNDRSCRGRKKEKKKEDTTERAEMGKGEKGKKIVEKLVRSAGLLSACGRLFPCFVFLFFSSYLYR